MRLNIFQKAKYLLTTKQIKKIIETDYSTSFKVGKYHVVAKYQNHKLIWLCDCMANQNYLCAHKIAAQDYLIHSPISVGSQMGGMQTTSGPTLEKERLTSIEKDAKLGQTNPAEDAQSGNNCIPAPQLGLDHLTERQKEVLKEMVNNKCEDCRQKKDLEIHRMKRGVDGGKYIPSNIRILCSDCHDMYDY